MYISCQGTLEDNAEAAKWSHLAAVQGHTKSQTRLGSMYYFGIGLPKDFAEAAMWFGRAAESGDVTAQNNLGVLYLNGWGVPRDTESAYVWFRIAGERGVEQSSQFAEDIAQDLTVSQIEEAERLVDEWMTTHP